MVGLNRYAAVADEEGLRINLAGGHTGGCGVGGFELELRGDATAEVDADRVCLVGYYSHRLVDGKDTEQLRGCDSGLCSRSNSGCNSVGIIRFVYYYHKMVVTREERAGYGFGKIFINGGILRGAEGECVVGIEDSQRDAAHACLRG